VNRDALAEDTLTRYCLPLVRKVREEQPEEWGRWLEAIPADRVRVMAVLLAALVPVDESVSDLTAWVRYIGAPDTVEEIDGELVDLVAIERALAGREKADLTPAEQRAAARIGTHRGRSAAELGRLLGTSARTVQRLRGAS
jgi:hypothetical protein